MAYLERGEGVRGDVEGGELHVMEEAEEILGEEHRPGERLVTQTLSQHHAAVQSHFWAVVSAQVDTCQRSCERSRTQNSKPEQLDETEQQMRQTTSTQAREPLLIRQQNCICRSSFTAR